MAEQKAGLNKGVSKAIYGKGDTISFTGELGAFGRITADRTKAILFIPLNTTSDVTQVSMTYTGTAYVSTSSNGVAVSSITIEKTSNIQLRVQATLASLAPTASVACTVYFNNANISLS